ncbi:MAG TPA: hypothetical protein PKM44_13815, partial [Turneriella sp.]|nr:hypothetical protein [Turneriella sp.]
IVNFCVVQLRAISSKSPLATPVVGLVSVQVCAGSTGCAAIVTVKFSPRGTLVLTTVCATDVVKVSWLI